jgi:hypothetical protein
VAGQVKLARRIVVAKPVFTEDFESGKIDPPAWDQTGAMVALTYAMPKVVAVCLQRWGML